MEIKWTTYRGGRTYILATIDGKAFGRIDKANYFNSPNTIYSVTYLEWDEKKWPEKPSSEDKFFAIHGHPLEVHVGVFKTEYQAKRALERHIQGEI